MHNTSRVSRVNPILQSLVWLVFAVALVSVVAIATGCSGKKKKDTVELSELKGKHVALMAVDGESTAKKVVEVALINQLVKNGTFIIVNKRDVEAARKRPEIDPMDWKRVAEAAGADLALNAKVLKFSADTQEGYSEEEVEDSQLAEERGDDGKTKRVYKVRSMKGEVEVELQFADVKNEDLKRGVAHGEDTVTVEAKDSAAHLPPALRFLEKIANKAFEEFFEKYD